MKKIMIFVALLAFAVPGATQNIPNENALRAHVEILASDRFQGRRPGTIGEALAAHYIAAQFAQAGLEPGNAGSFYQAVPLVDRSSSNVTAAWQGDGGTIATLGTDEFIAFGRESHSEIDLPIVFVGYGEDPEALAASMDLSQVAVLVSPGAPEGVETFPSFNQRRRALAEAGAAAVISYVGEEIPWAAVEQAYRNGRSRAASRQMSVVEGTIGASALERVLALDGNDIEQLEETALEPGFQFLDLNAKLTAIVQTEIREFSGQNIVAMLPGQSGAGEAILFLAHYDHLGICRPESESDKICNGAVDNASGTAALIGIAQALASSGPHQRDIVFLATTAEEMGLLGAYHYTANPTVPLTSIVAALNLDTIAIAPQGMPVGIVGRGLTPTLDQIVDNAAASLGRDVYEGLEPNDFVHRQDGWALVAEGVPAIMAGGSFVDRERLTAYLQGPYHDAEDNPGATLDLSGAYEDMVLHIELGRRLADPAHYGSSVAPQE